jgi:two-component sensor histidine kinase
MNTFLYDFHPKLNENTHDTEHRTSVLFFLIRDVDGVTLNLENVIVCGLMVNELIMNAFNYVFNGNSKGKIKVSLITSVDSP